MANNEEYNGWKNRTTWAVALHLDNTQSTEKAARAAAKKGEKKALADIKKNPSWYEDEKARKRARDRRAGEAVIEYAVSLLDRVVRPGSSDPSHLLATDLLNYAMADVDEAEIGAHFLDE